MTLDWIFNFKGRKLRRKIERDEIKAVAEDEVWRMRQSSTQLRDAMERHLERSIRDYVKGGEQ